MGPIPDIFDGWRTDPHHMMGTFFDRNPHFNNGKNM